jgi:PAS domain S-box-containing protein
VEKKAPRKALKKGSPDPENNAFSMDEGEALLMENESRLSQIIQGLPIAAFVIDRHHAMTHCNSAFERLTGLSAGTLIGTRHQWKSFYPSERPTLADFIVDGASEGEIAKYYESKYKKSVLVEGAYEVEDFFPDLSDGGKWLFFTAAPLVDEEGRITGAIETLQDISDRKRAEHRLRKSERRLRALLDFEPYPVVVFNLDGLVSYLNPAFSEVFGWRLEELEGKKIPFVPSGLEEETRNGIRKLMKERVVLHFETQRLTKDGQTLDVVIRAAVFAETKDEPAGIILILRDVTKEKRMALSNEAMIRISMALPEYPDLEELLTYINHEVKRLLGTEGAIAVLHDEIRGDLFVVGAAYDDTDTERRIEEARFSMDQLVAGRVIKTGEPMIVPDTSQERALHEERDRRLGYKTRNLVIVPLKSSERVIGALCAINKKGGPFAQSDTELLNMIAGTVALSVENARFAEDLKKAYRNNDALLRISMALPKHPDLEDLLDYVNEEVKRLLNAEGSVALLLDEEKNEFYVLGAAYDATDTKKRVKEIRFPVGQLVAGKVVRTGQPLIISDTSLEPHLHKERDRKLGYSTRSLVLAPLRSRERIIGVLSAINKKDGSFSDKDLELLSLIAGTVALSIENAKFSEELKKAYREVSSLNRAKDKAINHLSHELKTPVAILTSSINLLGKRLGDLPEEAWKPTAERIKRNLLRILDIQYEVDDIIQSKRTKAYDLLHLLLDQCTDQLMTLVAEQCGEGPVVEKIGARIDELFGPKVSVAETLDLGRVSEERLEYLKPFFSHREVEIVTRIGPVPPIFIPREVLYKVLEGLIKNAVENTPDEGRIEVAVQKKGAAALFLIRDYGLGIPEEAQKRIFEGFFSTRDTMAYSSKRPFDFNAGGKGADLLRMKIFSERYQFQIDMASTRCGHIPTEADVCPGRIGECSQCSRIEDCHRSGGTVFSVYFQPAPAESPVESQS